MAQRLQDIFVFDNYSQLTSDGFHMLRVGLWFSPSLSSSSEVGFIIVINECTNNIGICLHEKTLALLLNDDFVFEAFLRNFTLAFLLKNFC